MFRRQITKILQSAKLRAKRGAMSVGAAISAIMGFSIGGYITAATLPDSLSILTNQTMWNEAVGAGTATATLGGSVLGLVVLAGTVFVFLKMAGIGGD